MKRKLKAVKSDDAAVPEYLWNLVLVPDGEVTVIRSLDALRSFILRWLKRRLTREFWGWFQTKYPRFMRSLCAAKGYPSWRGRLLDYLSKSREASLDWEAGAECVERYANSDWWEWSDGSRPHFWRWPSDYQTPVRDGVSPWLKERLPRWLVPQRAEREDSAREAMKRKLDKVRRMRYLAPGRVESLTSFFSVPKGENDTRMVYDGTKSGLNDAMWAPWFALPTVEAHLRFVTEETYMGDMDIGDMFHNFMLHEKVQVLAGIDLTSFYPAELTGETRVLWERWKRAAMGLRNFPYNTIQGVLFAEELIRGDHLNENNVFRWDTVRLNLPGSPTYMPHLTWVSKIRAHDGKVACDYLTFVDDTRACGNSWQEARSATRKVASTLNWLGIQDAARKRRDPSQEPGPWAGSVIHVSEQGTISVSVTQERWDKARRMVFWIKEAMETGDVIEFKTLESHRGFLVYVSRTYPMINPYLKGIHLSLDSWRGGRAVDGWKLTAAEAASMMGKRDWLDSSSDPKAPKYVRWVPRLKGDIEALCLFLAAAQPPKRAVRPARGSTVVYSFGDASGNGFGGMWFDGNDVAYHSGQWADQYASQSSNFRELANLVLTLEQAHADGTLKNSEVFIFTDNSTAESTFFRGTSSSRTLFELILRLQFIHMHGEVIVHFIHVAGKRMIRQGTDGLSRGNTGRSAKWGGFSGARPSPLDCI